MWPERPFRLALAACAALLFALGPAVGAVLVVGAVRAPAAATPGLWGAVGASVLAVALAVGAATPIGVGAGLFLAEVPGTAADLLRDLVHEAVRIPSVVHGVFGLAVFVGLMGLGHGTLAVALTLALVVLPGIVLATEEAVSRVPTRRREAALALGASRWQVVTEVVVPSALGGIGGGLLSAVSRALGEAAPLLVLGIALAGALPSRLFADAVDGEGFALALGLGVSTAALSLGASLLRGPGRSPA